MDTSTPRPRPQTSNSRSPAICRTCKEEFLSRNALFEHFKKTLHFLRTTLKPSLRTIISSKASKRKVGTGYAYRDFNYCEIRYQLSATASMNPGAVPIPAVE